MKEPKITFIYIKNTFQLMIEMRQGFIFRYMHKMTTNYFGIDACDPENETWPYLEEWNLKSPNQQILLEGNNIASSNKSIQNILEYIKWVRLYKECNDYGLFFFFEDLQTENTVINDSFVSLGYDCVYVEDDNLEDILFSTILNEIHTTVNENIFFNYSNQLNQNGLFDSAIIAQEYLNFRELVMREGEGNLETAWANTKPSVVKVFVVKAA